MTIRLVIVRPRPETIFRWAVVELYGAAGLVAAGAFLLLVYLLSVSPMIGQSITFSLQSHGETCDQIGNACKRLSLWTATVRNPDQRSRTVTKAALLEALTKIGVAARDDQSAARVVLHQEKRGAWRVAGGVIEGLLMGCAGTGLATGNYYLAGGCAVVSQLGPGAIKRAQGLEPQVSKALTEIIGTQHLELTPGGVGLMVLFSTRYDGQATYEIAAAGGGVDGDPQSEIPRATAVSYPVRIEPSPSSVQAGAWLPVGHYWGPCAEFEPIAAVEAL
jgi:hypothetical protein